MKTPNPQSYVEGAMRERQDAVEFLRRQAQACRTPERIAALNDAADALARGLHVGCRAGGVAGEASSDRDLLTSTVHELRNTVVPPLLASKRLPNDASVDELREALAAANAALWRVNVWADKVADHLRKSEETR